MPTVHLLDYVAGNVRSLVNAIEKSGYEVDWVRSPEDVPKAEVRKTRLQSLTLMTNQWPY
jgi:imidazoleglycerol phosphate synthase glutamine amidotransferase subunit HisH